MTAEEEALNRAGICPICYEYGHPEEAHMELIPPQKAETIQLRKWLFYLVERVPIDADPKLTEIAAYVQEHWRRGEFKE